MPSRIVRQPNGLYAVFSTVVDNFTFYGMTYEEAAQQIGSAARVMQADNEPERFKESMETIALVHGIKAAESMQEELSIDPAIALGGTE